MDVLHLKTKQKAGQSRLLHHTKELWQKNMLHAHHLLKLFENKDHTNSCN